MLWTQSSGRLDHGNESWGFTRAWIFMYQLSKYQLFRKPASWGLLNVCTFPLFLQEGEKKIEYRVWNPFRSKLAAAILGGVDQIHMPPGSKVLYLGAASGTTVSHVSDVVGPVSWWTLLHHFCRNSLIQWRPLIIITDNVINRLLLSKSVVPKHSI
jgi:hypothetical protein